MSRQSVRKIDTEALQGKGSYVVLSGLKVSEVKEMQTKAEAEDYDAFSGGLEIVARHIKDWNWEDDDGNALPLPSEDADVMGKLTMQETEFLSKQLLGQTEEAKN